MSVAKNHLLICARHHMDCALWRALKSLPARQFLRSQAGSRRNNYERQPWLAARLGHPHSRPAYVTDAHGWDC